jgi:hypothetical protein
MRLDFVARMASRQRKDRAILFDTNGRTESTSAVVVHPQAKQPSA